MDQFRWEQRLHALPESGTRTSKSAPGLPRWFDALAAAAGLAVLSPVFAVIATAIKLSDGGQVLYRQRRVGQGFCLFFVYKFRTMLPNGDRMGAGVTWADDPRVTRLGRLLRQFKLDELPQLLNVLRGEMALVGPRPEVPEYVERFRAKYSQLLRGRPGITDPATLEFSNEEELLSGADFEQTYVSEILPKKLALSLGYFDHRTWKTDLAVVLRTLGRVVLPGKVGRAAHRAAAQEPTGAGALRSSADSRKPLLR